MDDLARLISVEAVKQLRARYCRCIDTKAWAELRSVLAPDVELDLPSLKDRGGVRGADAFIDLVQTWFANSPSLHLNVLPEIEIRSESAATAIWKQEHFLPQAYSLGSKHGHGYGYSYDTYEKRDGVWLVKSVRLEPHFAIT